MKKKKVLILGKLPPPYMGPAIATEIILQSSLKERYELFHLNTKANDSLRSLGKWSIKKVLTNIMLYIRMFRLLVSKRPQIALIPISQTTMGFIKDFFFIALARLTFTKVIVQLRGSNFRNWYNHTGVFTKTFIRLTLRSTQGVIVLGEKLRYLFEEIFNPDSIFVVPNGGNYKIEKQEKKQGVIHLLYLATLMEEKGILDVIDAAAILHSQKINFHLDVVGDWLKDDTKNYCTKLVSENNLPVTFHASKGKTEKFLFMSASDVFLFPPRSPEGHPWVIVEALAAGLPVISTDQGAITESVIDNENGFIIPHTNAIVLASKIKLLIENNALREKMSKASLRNYNERFTEEKMVENLSRVFDSILAR